MLDDSHGIQERPAARSQSTDGVAVAAAGHCGTALRAVSLESLSNAAITLQAEFDFDDRPFKTQQVGTSDRFISTQ